MTAQLRPFCHILYRFKPLRTNAASYQFVRLTRFAFFIHAVRRHAALGVPVVRNFDFLACFCGVLRTST